jgi:hypothetical protein
MTLLAQDVPGNLPSDGSGWDLGTIVIFVIIVIFTVCIGCYLIKKRDDDIP